MEKLKSKIIIATEAMRVIQESYNNQPTELKLRYMHQSQKEVDKLLKEYNEIIATSQSQGIKQELIHSQIKSYSL